MKSIFLNKLRLLTLLISFTFINAPYAQSNTTTTTNQQTFQPNKNTQFSSSDASSAIALKQNFMLVLDDETNVFRIYPRTGARAIKEISYDAFVTPGQELDAEASTRLGNTIFIIGSHSNNSKGEEQNNREFILKFKIKGTGKKTRLFFKDKYSQLEKSLINWDAQNKHHFGANYFGFNTATQSPIAPESTHGFSIEGLSLSPDNQYLWLGFRAPMVNQTTRDKALIIPVLIQSIMTQGKPTTAHFGAPILLNLGGRAIRSLKRLKDNTYLILAGASGSGKNLNKPNFRLFTWSGNPQKAPIEHDADLDALRQKTKGSFETIVGTKTKNGQTWVQILQDNGDTVWKGKHKPSKKLKPKKQQFNGFWINLGNPLYP